MSFAYPLLLDGPTGTELQRRGVNTNIPLWSAQSLIENPEVVVDIHTDYIRAGADVLTTNSFRTNSRVIERAGWDRDLARRLTEVSVELARSAIVIGGRDDILIAGSDAPVEDCYQPGLVPSERELQEEHAEHISWLLEAGCDFILVETMNTMREALAAARAAVSFNAPYMVSLVTDFTGRNLLSGETLHQVVSHLSELEPEAILFNCTAPDTMVASMREIATIRTEIGGEWYYGGYPNSGNPDPILGWESVQNVTMEAFLDAAAQILDTGGSLLGGCCGTGPKHIQNLAALLARHKTR